MNRFVMFAAALVLTPCAVFVSAAHAAPATAKPLMAQTLDAFKQDEARIRKDMQSGGKYGYISSSDKSLVETRLADMQSLLAAHSNASDMPAQDKIALFNAQEEINSILYHNDNDRLVCEHKAKMGTNIATTTCRTYGEMKIEQREAQRYLEKRSQTPSTKRGN